MGSDRGSRNAQTSNVPAALSARPGADRPATPVLVPASSASVCAGSAKTAASTRQRVPWLSRGGGKDLKREPGFDTPVAIANAFEVLIDISPGFLERLLRHPQERQLPIVKDGFSLHADD